MKNVANVRKKIREFSSPHINAFPNFIAWMKGLYNDFIVRFSFWADRLLFFGQATSPKRAKNANLC
jgi:hypothetical protein